MRTHQVTGIGLIALIALTACGGDDGERQQESSATETEAQQEDLTQEVEEDPQIEEAPEADDQEGVAPRDRDFSDDPILADREFTGRMTGDVAATLGEPVEVDFDVFEGIGNYAGTVTLDSLVGAPVCDSDSEEGIESANGYYLYAFFTLEAAAEAEESFDISEQDFRWSGFNDHITHYDAWQCQESVNGLMDPVRPGESAERIMVFDIPEFEGTLSYGGASHYIEWEIERDDYDNGERLPMD